MRRAASRATSLRRSSRKSSERNGRAHPRKAELRDFVPRALWEADYGEIGTQRVVIRPEAERAKRRTVLADLLVSDYGVSRDEALGPNQASFSARLAAVTRPRRSNASCPNPNSGERFGALIASPEREKWRDENLSGSRRPDWRSSRPIALRERPRRATTTVVSAEPDRRARAERDAQSHQ